MIDIKANKDNETIEFDSSKKELTIELENQKKYKVYLYEVGKEKEIYFEIMTEMQIKDLEHQIFHKLTNKRIRGSIDVDRIYYVSQYDNRVHNINDMEHQLIKGKQNMVYIGRQFEDGFEVDEEVELWTIKEVASFY